MKIAKEHKKKNLISPAIIKCITHASGKNRMKKYSHYYWFGGDSGLGYIPRNAVVKREINPDSFL